MKDIIDTYGKFFYRSLAGVAIGGPALLVCAASLMPESPERGEFMLNGLGAVLAILVTCLLLRAFYVMGFTKALSIAASRPNRSVTA